MADASPPSQQAPGVPAGKKTRVSGENDTAADDRDLKKAERELEAKEEEVRYDEAMLALEGLSNDEEKAVVVEYINFLRRRSVAREKSERKQRRKSRDFKRKSHKGVDIDRPVDIGGSSCNPDGKRSSSHGWFGAAHKWMHTVGFVRLVGDTSGFHIEGYKDVIRLKDEDLQPTLETLQWYQSFFAGEEHINYAETDTPLGPVIISARKEGDNYRLIIRTKDADQRLLIPAQSVEPSGWNVSPFKLLKSANPLLSTFSFPPIESEGLSDLLVDLETKQIPKTFKFGVLYCAPGQTTEEEMFANSSGSDDFNEFLTFIGQTVDLQGFEGFSAGLDTRLNQTGLQSTFCQWREYSIMFHVSTQLPHTANDTQQIEKKRHIGNDIVLIVFQDAEDNNYTPYSPVTVRSEFIHVVIVVRAFKRPGSKKTYYRMSVSHKDGVPPFGPVLPNPPLFRQCDEFRNYFLTKCINAEIATYHGRSPLASKLTKARHALLADVLNRYKTAPSTRADAVRKNTAPTLSSSQSSSALKKFGRALRRRDSVGSIESPEG